MSANPVDPATNSLLHTACEAIGLDATGAELLRSSENAIYRLPGQVIVRISRPGQQSAASREVAVAQWLEASGVSAVRVISGLDQPVVVDNRPVTFWHELPPHHHGTPAQVAEALKHLHTLPPPATFTLPDVAPFVRLEERIADATVLQGEDRQWLLDRLGELRERWESLPNGLPWCVIHGDAWVGNVAATDDGQVFLLDLERTAIGPPEWDLVHTAIKQSSFGWITEADYQEFVRVYGHDVTAWAGFGLLREIRELRMTTMALQTASVDPAWQEQATVRLRSIQGRRGPRPWSGWRALE